MRTRNLGIAACVASAILAVSTAASAQEAPAGAASSDARIWVFLVGADDARLQQDTTGDHDYETVCQAPGEAELPAGFPYRVVGDDIVPSADFTLHAPAGGREMIHVRAASKGGLAVGIVALLASPVITMGGMVMALHNLSVDGSAGAPGPDTVSRLGVGMLVAGPVMAIAGLVLVLSNGRTSVHQEVAGVAGLRDDGAAPVRRETAFTNARIPALPSAPGMSIPLFSARF